MKVEFYQDGELMVLDCVAVEKANTAVDFIITVSDEKDDKIIIDRNNLFGVYAT